MTPLQQKWYRHIVARCYDLAYDRNHYAYDRRTQDEDDRAVKALMWRMAEMAAPRTPRERLKAEISALEAKHLGVYWDYQTLTEKTGPSRRLAAIIVRMADAMEDYACQIALLKRTLAALEAEQ